MTLNALPAPNFTGADLAARVNSVLAEARAARRFPSAAAILTDAVLAYGTGPRSVAAGDRLATADGLAYDVAPAAATDHHVTTAGGVKLIVPADGAIHIRAFGGMGGNSTADTAAFRAFRRWALAQQGAVTLHLQPQTTYLVADPYWPCDIPVLVVEGHGATIKNSSVSNVNKSLLNPALGTDRDGLNTFYTPVSRFALNTTVAGAGTVTTRTAADAGNFAVGEWVMIASLDIQFTGQPPNLRLFEFHQITAINAATGVLSLAGRVKFTHRDDFPYVVYANGDGRAHVYKIEQGSRWGIRHVYNDITFLRNDVSSAGATSEAVYATGLHVEFNRCTAPWFLPSVAETVQMNGCEHGTDTFEPDKLVSNLKIKDSRLRSKVYAGTGIYNFEADNTAFLAGYDLAAQRISLRNCSVAAPSQDDVQLFASFGSVEQVEIVGGTHAFLPTYTVTTTQTQSVTLNGTTVAWNPATSSLTVNLATPARQTFAAHLFVGSVILVTANSGVGTQMGTGVHGIVRSVTSGGAANQAVAVIDFSEALAGTETLTWYPEPALTRIEVPGFDARDWVLQRPRYLRRRLRVGSNLDSGSIPVLGRLRRLVVDVVRPYTGATTGNVTLSINRLAPVAAAGARLVDLRTAGRRETGVLGHAGWTATGGESAGAGLSSAGYRSGFWSSMSLTGPTMASTSEAELPVVDVLMEFESPYDRSTRL
jgi:hypothetical protein